MALRACAPDGRAGGARRPTPTLEHEAWLWSQGYALVAGVDEAGRGALAGPLVAAAVILPPHPEVGAALAGVRDSKLLTPPARARLDERIRECALAVGVAVVPAALVDGAGLSAAGQLAFCRAVEALERAPDFLLVDAFRLRAARQPQLALVHGDSRCLSIAAASIIAKVTRDRLMDELHAEYPQYAFGRHRGYATGAHQDALASHGPCPQHRRSYAPVRAWCGR
ncbi:MAG TPA: ribonuclease HII [Chloroflexota bacterium]|nr:ribonuclease HII [Chloroflexota bacterium]